jgi:hypothetical protein
MKASAGGSRADECSAEGRGALARVAPVPARDYVLRFGTPAAPDGSALSGPDARNAVSFGACARFRYMYRPHGYAAYADGKVQPLAADRNSLDCVAQTNHDIRKERFMEVLPGQVGHDELSAMDLMALCHVLAEDLPVPLMMHLLMIRQKKMRLTIRGVEQAKRLSMALRGACRRVFGTVGDYVHICERLTYAEDIDVADIPEVDSLSVLVDYTYVYGKDGEANRYLVIWKPDAAAWMVARKMGMRGEPFFWLHENTNEELDDILARPKLVSVKFLPIAYRRCSKCALAVLPLGPFIYDRSSTFFTALIDNISVCLC